MVTLLDLRAYWRFLKVIRQFLPLVFAYARDRRRFLAFGGSRQVSREQQRERAQWLLDSLLTLGPTFIKLGQLLSTRPDVLPPAYIDVLSRLQDDVPPAEWEGAKQVLEEELGPIDEAFDDFDRSPISGASLGQVYVATRDDRKVAVKVRRPGVESLVEADLQAIRWTLPLVLFFVDENRAFSMRNLADEFAKTIREEMDYRREARMLEEIRDNFADNDDVVIPEVLETSDRVLVMEYVGGTKITRVRELDRKGIDRSQLAETLQKSYLQMMIQDGIFHADPHPGNLAVTDEGQIIFYDFGMSGRVRPFIQDRIVDFYTAVANRDIDAILDTLIAMGTLSPEADRGVMADVMEVAIQDARGQEVDQYRVQQIVEQVEDTIYEFPLRMPRDLALVMRVATVVEGVCVTLDEDFDFIAVATDYLRAQGYFEATVRDRARQYAGGVRDTAGALLRTPPKIEHALDRIERDDFQIQIDLRDSKGLLDRLARRLVYGFLVAFGGLSTAILYAAQQMRATALSSAITIVLGFYLYRALRGPKGLRTGPQFTRQNLKEQETEEAESGSLAPGPEIEPEDGDGTDDEPEDGNGTDGGPDDGGPPDGGSDDGGPPDGGPPDGGSGAEGPADDRRESRPDNGEATDRDSGEPSGEDGPSDPPADSTGTDDRSADRSRDSTGTDGRSRDSTGADDGDAADAGDGDGGSSGAGGGPPGAGPGDPGGGSADGGSTGADRDGGSTGADRDEGSTGADREGVEDDARGGPAGGDHPDRDGNGGADGSGDGTSDRDGNGGGTSDRD